MRTQDGHRVVIVAGVVLAHYAIGDRMAEAHAMVSLVEQGWADQNEVAQAFGWSARTVRRDQRRYEDGGLAALGQPRGYPEGRARLTACRRRTVQQLKGQGHSHCEIARRLGVTETAVRKLLRRMGWKESPAQPPLLALEGGQGSNPKLSAFCATAKESCAASQDACPSHRRADRLLARLGLLEDAPPLFGSATALPRAGVLLALPVLVSSGVFDCAQKIYGNLGPAFYGLRTSLLTLLLMALWRIKRPEGLKEYSPQDLGRVLGLDRAPEVKTLRRKLARLAAAGRAAQFGQALAQQRVALRGAALGFLYTDGHVRV
ncbi:MAG: putative transposase, partial [Verrucomicrobiota bacterium]